MDEQGISSVFYDRLNPTLYDLRVYEQECPYAPMLNLVIHPQPLATLSSTSSSDDSDTSSADSPLTQLAVRDKGTSKFTPDLTDVRESAL
ncbi:hypothetical protein LIER_30295 [Lithospermum erythrorhizon]|uniref:Uncharacterized protein n=1 Tax=Lithospermum erythrorhizon TaxID=34254 RepID=A0AAV3RML9_LITER